jgi:hypothetical protein
MGRFRDLFQGKEQKDGLTSPEAAPIVEEVANEEEAPSQEEVFAPETVAESAEVSTPDEE